MKLPLGIPTLTLAMLAAVSLSGQTITSYSVVPAFCGAYNPATYYCPPMQIADADGVQQNWFYLPEYNGRLNLVGFKQTIDYANVTSITNTFDGTTHTQILTFQGVDFSGSSTITYTTKYYPGGGGRGCGGCGTKWTLTGGTVSVARSPITDSPIAPTPTCIPDPPKTACTPSDQKQED